MFSYNPHVTGPTDVLYFENFRDIFKLNWLKLDAMYWEKAFIAKYILNIIALWLVIATTLSGSKLTL